MVHGRCLLGSALLLSALGAVHGRAQDPQLKQRPKAAVENRRVSEPHFHLDVMVDDANGNAVPGLEPWDFKLTDNGKASKIVFFRAFDDVVAKPDPPVEVILLIDEINLPFSQVAFVKEELARFLRQNGGQVAYPVSLMLLSNKGLRVQPRPTENGEALLKTLRGIAGSVRMITPAMAGNGFIERAQRSIRAIDSLAVNEARKPGRKLLIWVGPGWPMLDSTRYAMPDDLAKLRYFRSIVDLTNELREARMTVYSVSGDDSGVRRDLLYQDFLKGVVDLRQANASDLALKVLVTHTGGRILGPNNDLAGHIDACIADAKDFYEIDFLPAATQHPDEYHTLSVTVDRPGWTVRTYNAYYAEPPGN